jgi:hypothetical protein
LLQRTGRNGGIAQNLKADQGALFHRSSLMAAATLVVVRVLRLALVVKGKRHQTQQHLCDNINTQYNPFVAAAPFSGCLCNCRPDAKSHGEVGCRYMRYLREAGSCRGSVCVRGEREGGGGVAGKSAARQRHPD